MEKARDAICGVPNTNGNQNMLQLASNGESSVKSNYFSSNNLIPLMYRKSFKLCVYKLMSSVNAVAAISPSGTLSR